MASIGALAPLARIEAFEGAARGKGVEQGQQWWHDATQTLLEGEHDARDLRLYAPDIIAAIDLEIAA